jgi:hypothetical protein
MSLTFGTHQVQDNEILTPIITSNKLEFTTPLVLANYVTLLLNTTTDVPHWLFVSSGEEIIPYKLPVDSGKYLFIIYDTNGIKLPSQIYDTDFTLHHKSKDLGKQLFKITFYVQDAALETYPDISINIFKNLTISQIKNVCASYTGINNICKNNQFKRMLVAKYLSSKPEYIKFFAEGLTTDQLIEHIEYIDSLLDINDKDLYPKINNYLPKLLNFDIGLNKLLAIRNQLRTKNINMEDLVYGNLLDSTNLGEYKQFLVIYAKLMVNHTSEIITHLYANLLYSVITKFQSNPATRDSFVDATIKNISDQLFESILERSLVYPSRSLLDVMLQYLNPNDRQEYIDRYEAIH